MKSNVRSTGRTRSRTGGISCNQCRHIYNRHRSHDRRLLQKHRHHRHCHHHRHHLRHHLRHHHHNQPAGSTVRTLEGWSVEGGGEGSETEREDEGEETGKSRITATETS